MAAIKQNGLQYASVELNSQIVMEASRTGTARRLAELQGDREIVMEAVKQNGKALRYASVELKGGRET